MSEQEHPKLTLIQTHQGYSYIDVTNSKNDLKTGRMDVLHLVLVMEKRGPETQLGKNRKTKQNKTINPQND